MHVNITQRDIEVIFYSSKGFIYNNEIPRVKKEGNGFDVTMRAYDGTEICELIGIFVLSLIGKKYDSENIGLYRDGGLSVFRNASGPELEKIKNRKYSKKNIRCYRM